MLAENDFTMIIKLMLIIINLECASKNVLASVVSMVAELFGGFSFKGILVSRLQHGLHGIGHQLSLFFWRFAFHWN